MNGVLELIPVIVLYAFVALAAGIALIVAWMVWRRFAPPAPGIPLGWYEIKGFYAGGDLFKKFEGRLVDATSYFLSPEIAYQLKEGMIEDVEEVLQRSSLRDAQDLKEALNDFRDWNGLDKILRVLVIRQRLAKHVLIQWGHIGPLNQYASNEEEVKFSFGFGHESKGTIGGSLHSLPHRWDIKLRENPEGELSLGKCYVHLFKPYDRRNKEDEVKPPEYLAKIALYAPIAVESKELWKSMERRLEQKDHNISKLTEENERLSALADTYKSMLSEGEAAQVSPKAGGFGVVHGLLLGIPAAIGYFLANYLGYDVTYGVVGGLIAGAVLLYWRLKRR